MRKFLAAILSIALLLPMPATWASGNISVVIDGVTQEYDQPPALINGSTMVPLRGIFETLGATVNAVGSDIEATRGTTVINLTIGSDTATINGNTVKLAQKSQVINGRTLVPLRFVGEALGANVDWDSATQTVKITSNVYVSTFDVALYFPSDRYPETALHIYGAISQGLSDICTIDRDGADENRRKSLAGIDTRSGYDRDEWPMAMCEEGGEGASVAYIDPSDNRGAGAWVGNQLESYPDGTRVKFIVNKPELKFDPIQPVEQPKPAAPTPPTPVPEPTPPPPTPAPQPVKPNVTYANCTEARRAGVTPLYVGDPGYSTKLDRDRDGIACE